MKWGLHKNEAKGAAALILIILLFVGAEYFYRYIKRQELVEKVAEHKPTGVDSIVLFPFDPNIAKLPELMSLGLTKQEAVSIIRYREYGKVFRIKEDLFTCYGISDSLYYALEPYIEIGEEYRIKRKEEYESSSNNSNYYRQRQARELLPISKFRVDTVGAEYLVAVGALTRRQAAVFVKWRDMSGIYDIEELKACYVVSDSLAYALEPYAIFSLAPGSGVDNALVDINKADSAELRSVYGIGEKSVVAIMNYREKLGGFYSVEQLSELGVVTESNYLKIIKQISCDSCDISKIDVNFASAKTMKGHPYIAPLRLRRLLKVRELKGGWSTVEEMIEDDIFTVEEATRLRPYLLFEESRGL